MLRAQRRWCLTGTPIQNKMQDFGTLLKFLGIGPAENDRWFYQKVVKPVLDQNPQGMEKLRSLVRAYCLRRTKKILDDHDRLPGNTSKIQDITLSGDERRIYDACKGVTIRSIDAAVSKGIKGSNFGVIQSLQMLSQVCNHGADLLNAKRRGEVEEYLSLYGNNPNSMRYHNPRDEDLMELDDPEIPEIQLPNSMDIDEPVQAHSYGGPSSKVKALIHNIRSDQRQNLETPIKRYVYNQDRIT